MRQGIRNSLLFHFQTNSRSLFPEFFLMLSEILIPIIDICSDAP